MEPIRIDDGEALRRRQARLARSAARMREVKRLERHPHQQHAIHLLNARGMRKASQHKAGQYDDRDWWLMSARIALAKARELRLASPRALP